MKNGKRIAVIGGGLGGLVLAYRRLQKGDEVVVLEKSSEVGGLLAGFKINGTHLEKAYHHIFKTDKEIIALTGELGLEDKLRWNDSSIGLYYSGVMYPFVTPLELLRFKPLGLVDKVRLGLVALYLQKDNNWKKYIEVTAAEWMRKYCGIRAYEVVWEPLLKGKFHDYYDKVSMAWLWARIHTRGGSKEKGDTREKLGYYQGGFQVLVDNLVAEIKRMGGEIEVGCQISDIRLKNKRLIVNGKEYDKVVATVPSPVLTKLADFDVNYVNKLNSIDYLGAICVVFTSKQSLSKFYWHNINDLKSPFLAFIQQTNFIDKKNYQNEHVYYLGTYLPQNHRYFEAKEEVIYQEFFEYLEKIVGKFKVEQKFCFKLKNAQHVVTVNYPDKIPEYQTPIKNLYLMNFSQIFPEDRGTNFAVREANRMANYL